MSKQFMRFWIAFLVTGVSTFVIYWIWSQKREVLPPPMVIGKKQSPAVAPPPTKAETPDPLEEIRGIGPAFAKRLNEAGIVTFAQLALMSPEQVEDITGPSRWDPAEWIAQAGMLAGRE